ncbi:oxidoreductase [Methylocystis bryophila]|nr:oxidoreductase [Methylocystis bryophila]
MQLSVRSGGHSWAGTFLRDNVVLLDISRLRDFSIDREAMTGSAQPGLKGSELDKILMAQGLWFPTGHCTNVCLGGYLLQGGFGWNGREYGPACMSVIGVELVTAEGEVCYADEKQNADLFWAARGAGPGFFAVVTRFHIKVYPRSLVTMNNTYVYPAEVFEELYRWAHEIGRATPAEIHMMLLRDDSASTAGPITILSATAFAGGEEEARATLSLFEACPARKRAVVAEVNRPTTTVELTALGTDRHFDATKRYVADNIWTHATFDDLLPGLQQIVGSFPPAPTFMEWMNWGYDHEPPRQANMAYSLEDDFHFSLYTAWDNPADDAKFVGWTTERLRQLEPLSTGTQLADENLINRPVRFVSDENLRRLDALRTRYDPQGIFVSWLGRP